MLDTAKALYKLNDEYTLTPVGPHDGGAMLFISASIRGTPHVAALNLGTRNGCFAYP